MKKVYQNKGRKMKERYSVRCICNAYNGKPHEAGAGKCSGHRWAESIFLLENSECKYCNCTDGITCDVADGKENINQCEVYQQARQRGEYPVYFHPTTEQEILQKRQKEEQVEEEFYLDQIAMEEKYT